MYNPIAELGASLVERIRRNITVPLKAGRKLTDALLLFKMLVLQKLYNISDEELEYQVNDCLSFMEFLGLGVEDSVPDGTTVWLFREQLQKLELVEELFEQFEQYLQQGGYQAKDGQIAEVSDLILIEAPLYNILYNVRN